MRTHTPDDAMDRVDRLFADEPEMRKLCLDNWSESQKHVDWICTAPEQEIRDWLENCTDWMGVGS